VDKAPVEKNLSICEAGGTNSIEEFGNKTLIEWERYWCRTAPLDFGRVPRVAEYLSELGFK
jgi:hypothetical protein